MPRYFSWLAGTLQIRLSHHNIDCTSVVGTYWNLLNRSYDLNIGINIFNHNTWNTQWNHAHISWAYLHFCPSNTHPWFNLIGGAGTEFHLSILLNQFQLWKIRWYESTYAPKRGPTKRYITGCNDIWIQVGITEEMTSSILVHYVFMPLRIGIDIRPDICISRCYGNNTNPM